MFEKLVLIEIIDSPITKDIDMLLDIGMPVMHRNIRYNCRVFIYQRKIILIRPKKYLAEDGNYREMRWFAPWTKHGKVEEFYLPQIISDATGQITVPFGDGIITTVDTALAAETCEEVLIIF